MTFRKHNHVYYKFILLCRIATEKYRHGYKSILESLVFFESVFDSLSRADIPTENFPYGVPIYPARRAAADMSCR